MNFFEKREVVAVLLVIGLAAQVQALQPTDP